jgi:hypothetical protein
MFLSLRLAACPFSQRQSDEIIIFDFISFSGRVISQYPSPFSYC